MPSSRKTNLQGTDPCHCSICTRQSSGNAEPSTER